MIVSDHKHLLWLFNAKDLTIRLMRWRIKLEEYSYEIIYENGTMNIKSDALFRTLKTFITKEKEETEFLKKDISQERRVKEL